MDEFLLAASFLLILVGVLAVVCAIELIRIANREPRIGAATERATAAVTAALGSSIAATLGLNRIFQWGLDNRLVIGALVIAVSLVGVPSIVWLYRYRRDLLFRSLAISFTVAVVAVMYLVTTSR